MQLEQVIVNLLMNACEALARVDGPRQVAVTTRVVADRVEVVVSDNGPGVRPEVADRLFEPFVRRSRRGWEWAWPFRVRSPTPIADA